jgi:hypothetical protein
MTALLAIHLRNNRRACRLIETNDNVALSFVIALQ